MGFTAVKNTVCLPFLSSFRSAICPDSIINADHGNSKVIDVSGEVIG